MLLLDIPTITMYVCHDIMTWKKIDVIVNMMALTSSAG